MPTMDSLTLKRLEFDCSYYLLLNRIDIVPPLINPEIKIDDTFVE